MNTLVQGLVLGDAFGEALQRCWLAGGRPGSSFEVVERDDGNIGVTDAASYFASFEQWPSVEQAICDHATGRILDIGCGAGRHGLVLAERDLEVVGVDASPGAVAVAKERGLHAVEGLAEELPTDIGRFDTILMLGNNLGLLGGVEQAQRMLRGLAEVSNPGARILASSTDPYATSNEAHLAYHERNRQRGRLPGQVRMRVRHGMLATAWFDYLFVSEVELRLMLDDSPWRPASFHQDTAGYAVVLEQR